MTFDFRAADGLDYHFDTDGGQTHWTPLDAQPQQQEQPLEPSEEQSHG